MRRSVRLGAKIRVMTRYGMSRSTVVAAAFYTARLSIELDAPYIGIDPGGDGGVYHQRSKVLILRDGRR